MMDAMKTLNIDAINVGERDLKYGLRLPHPARRRMGLPVVSANLLDKKTRKPIFAPYVIKTTSAR